MIFMLKTVVVPTTTTKEPTSTTEAPTSTTLGLFKSLIKVIIFLYQIYENTSKHFPPLARLS